ncbi:pyrroloquinoline quinone-dependent dehydrogenase [Persicitalea sp.]|uniref:pyrroloquinoline quinone-dependent dehydrogenase n=1 Tax=Persicitalea sp. TaxID=3100273 RepID=UPI003593F0B9
MKSWKYPTLGLLLLWLCGAAYYAGPGTHEPLKNVDWRAYGGDPGGSRYSELSQINLQNVKNLKVAWTYDTGENKPDDPKKMAIQCQPIVVDGILYGLTPLLKVFAADAATGRELWRFDPQPLTGDKPIYHPARGVVYWENDHEGRILHSVGPWLYAIDAKTGKLVESFGNNGRIDLHEGLGDEKTLGYDVSQFTIRSTTPGVIYNNLIIMGSSTSEGGDALPGHIRAFDVRTGKLAWVFRTIPLPGEYGYETWEKNSYKKLGGANCWAGLVVDEKRGMVFMGTGSPSVDFYGGDREGSNLFANCVIALDAKTGKRIWHFQTVHHDLWDRDIPCPPNLITVKHKGKMVDAVAQATKDGLIFVFNRDTGEPLFPVEEVPVPDAPALPGEQPWPTQPVPTKPAPFARQSLTEADITNRTPESRAYVLDRFKNSISGPKNLPPSEKGMLMYGLGGGAEWGGTAADPGGIMYVNGNNMLWWVKMRSTRQAQDGTALSEGAVLFNTNCASCHAIDPKVQVTASAQAYPNLGNVGKRLSRSQIAALLETGRGRMPSFQHISKEKRATLIDFLLDTEAPAKTTPDDVHKVTLADAADGKLFPHRPPYVNNGTVQFLDKDDYPAIKSPWGTLNAVDLNTGEYLWRVTLGDHPEIAKKGVPPTGSENHGGPIVTAGGLLFIAGTFDGHLRAFDAKTGKVVWKYKLPTGAFATPITYMVNGKQYIAIAVGGGRQGLPVGGTYIAFALP